MVRAAMELVGERGPGGVTLAGVGERVGTSHAAVLYHFRTRQALLLAVLKVRDEEVRRAWEGPFATGGLQALRTLPRMAKAILDAPNFIRLALVLAAEGPGDDRVADYFRGRYHWMRSGLTYALRVAQQRGEARPDFDPATRAAQVTAFVGGIAVQHLVGATGTDIAAVSEEFVDALVEELSRSAGSASR